MGTSLWPRWSTRILTAKALPPPGINRTASVLILSWNVAPIAGAEDEAASPPTSPKISTMDDEMAAFIAKAQQESLAALAKQEQKEKAAAEAELDAQNEGKPAAKRSMLDAPPEPPKVRIDVNTASIDDLIEALTVSIH